MSTHITSLRPRITVADAAKALDFYTAALGGEELERHVDDDGRIVHAVVGLGELSFSLKDAGYGDQDPTAYGGTPVFFEVSSPDVDALADRMLAGGASVVYPLDDHGYGRGGRLADPFGHVWMLFQAG